MGELVALEMLVDKLVADEVLKKGIAEIALRRADAKFKAMVKCGVHGAPVAGDTVPQKIISNLMKLSNQNTYSQNQVSKALRIVDKNTKALAAVTKNMAVSVDSIYQMTNAVMNVSYLNAGISMANLAVDAAGFVIVTEKLNVLSSEVQEISVKIDRIVNVQKNEKISKCQKLIMQCKTMATKIKDQDSVDLDALEALIIDLRAFISDMMRNLNDNALSEDVVLRIVFTLLPAYTCLFSDFVQRYYYQKNSIPVNYDSFLSLYDELGTDNFIQTVENYYFLEQNKHAAEVVDILNAGRLLALNGKVQVEDQLALMRALETRENVILFDKEIKRHVEKRIAGMIPELAQECGLDEAECKKYLLAN